MKRGMILFSMVAMLAVSARCQTAMIALDDIPGTTLVCVTNYGPRLDLIEAATNDWRAALTNEAALRVAGDAAGLAALNATNAVLSAAITNEAALRAEHADRTDNPHGVTADQIGAATTQQLASAVAPLASTQQLAAAVVAIQIPVQSVNAKTGAVVLAAPDVGAVASSGDANVTLSDGLTTFSVSTSIGERIALDSFDQAIHIFRDGTVELYDYESERGFRELSLFDVPTYADLSDHPTFSQIAASNALPYTAWTGTITPADGTATVTIAHGNMPVLVADAPCVLTLDPTGYGTAGVSRVSLSYYPGANSFTFATNVINYAETPTVDTNGWNTLLIRRVSDGAWKGVGL